MELLEINVPMQLFSHPKLGVRASASVTFSQFFASFPGHSQFSPVHLLLSGTIFFHRENPGTGSRTGQSQLQILHSSTAPNRFLFPKFNEQISRSRETGAVASSASLNSGRRITSSGQRALDQVAGRVAHAA
ncbi:hypothetical protein Droror1_Dr00021174 [Drosera rotundifolia]